MYEWVCILDRDDSAYEIRMNDRISHFTNYQWQIHKVRMCVNVSQRSSPQSLGNFKTFCSKYC